MTQRAGSVARLNPNATNTDGDSLADGQELSVKTIKTPKPYPTKDPQTVCSDAVELSIGTPAWAIVRTGRIVGFSSRARVRLARSSNGVTGWRLTE
ncbi:MAG TPA: hypothetical protein VJ326_02950 [Thermoplasmata archaeon]|nr:hypothetical protein [Thermoplasmata archaeon]